MISPPSKWIYEWGSKLMTNDYLESKMGANWKGRRISLPEAVNLLLLKKFKERLLGVDESDSSDSLPIFIGNDPKK
jgi:hypothetical protein